MKHHARRLRCTNTCTDGATDPGRPTESMEIMRVHVIFGRYIPQSALHCNVCYSYDKIRMGFSLSFPISHLGRGRTGGNHWQGSSFPETLPYTAGHIPDPGCGRQEAHCPGPSRRDGLPGLRRLWTGHRATVWKTRGQNTCGFRAFKVRRKQ